MFASATANGFIIRRSTARGTVATSVTPDADNHIERDFAPTGVTLDTGWTAEPTQSTKDLFRLCGDLRSGSALFQYVWLADDQGIDAFEPLIIPDGTGLVIRMQNTFSNAPVDVGFGFGVG